MVMNQSSTVVLDCPAVQDYVLQLGPYQNTDVQNTDIQNVNICIMNFEICIVI